MDPKSTSSLDPKLRETYERVMGTNVPSQKPPQKETPLPPQVPPLTQPLKPQLQTPEPSPLPGTDPLPISDEMVQSPVFGNQNPFVETAPPPPEVLTRNAIVTPKPQNKKNKLMPLLLGLGGIVFFVVYGVIWAKLFGLF